MSSATLCFIFVMTYCTGPTCIRCQFKSYILKLLSILSAAECATQPHSHKSAIVLLGNSTQEQRWQHPNNNVLNRDIHFPFKFVTQKNTATKQVCRSCSANWSSDLWLKRRWRKVCSLSNVEDIVYVRQIAHWNSFHFHINWCVKCQRKTSLTSG